MHHIFLGLGSNTGDSNRILAEVRRELSLLGECRFSPVYRTAPLHRTDQPPYLNQAGELFTRKSPTELFLSTENIETNWGRNRSSEVRYGARTIDIDILLYDDLVVKNSYLLIPHPRMTERAFVLRPLTDLVPRGTHPRTDIFWADYLRKIDGSLQSVSQVE